MQDNLYHLIVFIEENDRSRFREYLNNNDDGIYVIAVTGHTKQECGTIRNPRGRNKPVMDGRRGYHIHAVVRLSFERKSNIHASIRRHSGCVTDGEIKCPAIRTLEHARNVAQYMGRINDAGQYQRPNPELDAFITATEIMYRRPVCPSPGGRLAEEHERPATPPPEKRARTEDAGADAGLLSEIQDYDFE